MTLITRLSEWGSSLELDDVPERVRALARSQVVSQVAAARATLGHELGAKVTRAFGAPLQSDPKRSAYVLAALTMALDYDDTVYAGHVTQSTVPTALAYARPLELDGRGLLAAVIAGNECAARITAAATLGRFRGQTAAHTHLAGGASARLRAEAAPTERWVDALALAFSAPPRTLQHAFLGSEAKLLTAATPLLMALDACDAATAGLRGAADLLEHEDGFLAAFAELPLPEAITGELGRRWHTETVSFKVYPGSAYLGGCVDCAVRLHERLGAVDPDEVEDVEVTGSVFTVELAHRAARYVDPAEPSAVALSFSVAYSVATALLTGGLRPADLAPPRASDPARWRVAERVHVEHSDALTRRAVRATAPVGEAIRTAGERGADWLAANGAEAAAELVEGIGPPSADFTAAEKAIGARVRVRLAGGRELEESCEIPTGAAGSPSRADHARLVSAKLLETGAAPDAVDALLELDELPAAELAEAIGSMLTIERRSRVHV